MGYSGQRFCLYLPVSDDILQPLADSHESDTSKYELGRSLSQGSQEAQRHLLLHTRKQTVRRPADDRGCQIQHELRLPTNDGRQIVSMNSPSKALSNVSEQSRRCNLSRDSGSDSCLFVWVSKVGRPGLHEHRNFSTSDPLSLVS